MNVAILIPAHNEERVFPKSLIEVVKIVAPNDLYIVDDGSSDKTSTISKKFTKNVLKINYSGKAHAINAGIAHFKLSKKYDYIFLMDADSTPKEDFLKHAQKHFERDRKKEIPCVSGRIKGYSSGWITKYRQWEYQLAFGIHKRAQAHLGSILVTPGCATVFRSSIFKDNEFPTGTLTEDMDFTFMLHRKGFSKMVFESKSIVYTADPDNVRDFVRQILRWYTGFWQVVRKYDIPWHGQPIDFEVALLATEGLYNGLLVVFLVFALFKLAFFGGIYILAIPLLIDLFLFFIPTLIWSSIADKDYTRIFYIPHFYFLRFLSSALFLISFFKGFLSVNRVYIWNSNRYLREEVY